MIGVQVRINNSELVANIQAIRIKPKGRTPEPGEMCHYQIRIYNQNFKTLAFPFGDAIALAHKMLDMYSNTSEDTILCFKRTEEEERMAEKIKKIQLAVGILH